MNAVTVQAVSGRFRRLERPVRAAAGRLLRHAKINGSVLEIFLVDGRRMNKNVLAFMEPKGFPRPEAGGRRLGEIHLNPQYIRREGEDLYYMLVHGFLHLLGYDHKSKPDRIRMEKKEAEFMKVLCRITS